MGALKGTVLHRTVPRDRLNGNPIRTYAERLTYFIFTGFMQSGKSGKKRQSLGRSGKVKGLFLESGKVREDKGKF